MIGDRPSSTRTSGITSLGRGGPHLGLTWGITTAGAARGELFTVMPERGLTPPCAGYSCTLHTEASDALVQSGPLRSPGASAEPEVNHQ